MTLSKLRPAGYFPSIHFYWHLLHAIGILISYHINPLKNVRPGKGQKHPWLEDSWFQILGEMGVWWKKWVTKVRYHITLVFCSIDSNSSIIFKLCILVHRTKKHSCMGFFFYQFSPLFGQKHDDQKSRVTKQFCNFFLFFLVFEPVKLNGTRIKDCYWAVLMSSKCRFCGKS